MSADLNKPVTSNLFTQILTDIRDMQAALAKMNHDSTANLQTGVLRWSDANSRFEKWNGSAWVALMPDASTTQKGVAQLSTSTTSTSTTLAATASAVKSVKDSVNNLNFTGIAGTATAGQVPNIQNLNGQATAGQVPNIDDLNGDISDLYAAAPSGHIRAGAANIFDGVNTGKKISFSSIDSTARTVGKTGSGADVIWSALDSLPANATAIICMIDMYGVDISSTATVTKAYFAEGTGTMDDDGSLMAMNDIKANSSSVSTTFAVIPLDGSQLFQYKTAGYGTLSPSPGFKRLQLYYRGFITD